MTLEQKNTALSVGINQDGSVAVFDEREILFAAADKTLGNALECGDLDVAAEALRRFKNLSYASSLSAAKLLHGINQNWQEWDHEEGDSFFEWAIRETGYDRETVKKRVCEWEFLNGHYIPKQFRSKIADYTIRQLDKVYSICVNIKENKEGGYMNYIEEDYEITEDHWLELSEAVDDQMVSDIVRVIKGKERNSNTLSLKIDDDGVLWAYQGNKAETIGQLFVEKKSELVEKAIRRICENSGITERNKY